MADRIGLSDAIRRLAAECGFSAAGIAPAGPIDHAEGLHHWLGQGYHAGMAYMADHLAERLCPQQLVPGAQSVICLAAGYAPTEDAPAGPTEAFVARYARRRNYHKELKRRCHRLMDRIRRMEPSFEGRAFVDTAPVAERSLAAAAGLGWIGRNGCLVVPEYGSYVLLCEVVCNLSAAPGQPPAGACGDCGACIRACPTGAIVGPAIVDSGRCLSYHTIENRGEVPRHLWPRAGNRVFGCDACQAACPHNQGPHKPPAIPIPAGGDLHRTALTKILGWSEDDWNLATQGSATRRATREMFQRNALISAGNACRSSKVSKECKDALRRGIAALLGRQPQWRELIEWAADPTGERPG